MSNGWRSDIVYGFYHDPKRLLPNESVSNRFCDVPGCGFRQGFGVLAASPSCFGHEFCQRGVGFIGFKFNTGGGTQYGWARVRMRSAFYVPENGFYVVDYAWADVGEPIRTRQIDSLSQEQGTVSPSGSLGLLALGKAGIELWRTQRWSSVTGK